MRFKKFSFYSDAKGNSKTAAGNGKIQSPANKVKRESSPSHFKSNSLHLDKKQDTENSCSPTQNRERRVSANNDFLMNSITTGSIPLDFIDKRYAAFPIPFHFYIEILC